MKHILLLLIVALSSTAYAENVKKWVDEHGEVHYGDSNAAWGANDAETVEMFDRRLSDEQEQLRKKKLSGYGTEVPPPIAPPIALPPSKPITPPAALPPPTPLPPTPSTGPAG